MSKVKIKSNPYEKQIAYFRWDQLNQQWFPINYESNPNSVLISEDMTTNFFPFKANMIVDVLIDEFCDGHLSIEFEGTDDEYDIIKAICDSDDYKDKVNISRSEITLENARDILPDIVAIYNEIRPIVERNIIQKEIVEAEFNKFTDATKEQVPVCIVGNYSAGKSSFINALIGHEILPSGDEPVTARVFKIAPSHSENEGFVRFLYEGEDVSILFNGNNQHVESELKDHPLIDRIRALIDPLDTVDLFRSINQVLKTINNFEEDELDLNISNLIEIEVPFDSTMFGDSNIDYVIFDTPGSNTATNYRHVEVLKQAMENMSNGLPIFVAEYNTLDSMDNEKLFKDIDSLDELDSRFTMVVVNKSDKANLPMGGLSAEDEDKILNMSIPRNLYSGGIYFVSSVIGLGSKTDGEFDDEFYEEVFDDVSPRFSNPEHKRYKCLYRYNIMPDQLKKNSIGESEKYDNLLLANSGLYCVEQEIKRFAEVYSAYNKCIQAELFLSKVINITFDDIDVAKTARVKNRINRSSMLEKSSASLIEMIEAKKEFIQKEYVSDYATSLKYEARSLNHHYDVEDFKEDEKLLKRKYEDEVDLDSFYADKRDSAEKLVNSLDFGRTKTSVNQIKDSFKSWMKESSRTSNAERAVQIKAANELMELLRARILQSNDASYESLTVFSEEYWKEKTELIRKEMVDLVSSSSGMDSELENKLEKLIVSYQKFNMHRPNIENFDKTKFESKIMAIISSDPLNLNRGKLISTYNNEVNLMLLIHCRNIYSSYIDCFNKWIRRLTDLLIANIVEINPELASLNEEINEETRLIDELESTRISLDDYANQIHKMIQWQK